MVTYRIFVSQGVTRPILILIIIFTLLNPFGAAGENDRDLLRLDICHPGQIPDFNNFETPTIVPGSTEVLKFSIQNRYKLHYDTNNMTNITLTVNIYTYTTLEKQKKIEDISNAPQIVGGNSALQTIPDKLTAVYFWSKIQDNETVPVEVSIRSRSNTPEGRYFVRMQLSFWFNNFQFNMSSRGYFSDSQWDKASRNITDEEGYTGPGEHENLTYGRLNLDILDVDGIIPETSIRVLTPIPIWPLFVLVGFAVLFIILAIIFYFMDEKGKFPHMKKKLDGWGKKINDIRYRKK